jgi:hypothetical protein
MRAFEHGILPQSTQRSQRVYSFSAFSAVSAVERSHDCESPPFLIHGRPGYTCQA